MKAGGAGEGGGRGEGGGDHVCGIPERIDFRIPAKPRQPMGVKIQLASITNKQRLQRATTSGKARNFVQQRNAGKPI